MRRIESRLDIRSEDFLANLRHNRSVADDLRNRQQKARFERPQRDMDRLKRQDKLFVRDRIELLARSRHAVSGAVHACRQHGI